MNEICCIGHITLDKVVTPDKTVHMAGGTSIYFSNAVRRLDLRYQLVTMLAKKEMRFVDELREKGIDVELASISAYTVNFENTYSRNQDHRTQRVLQHSDPFTIDQLKQVDAQIYHLGPLLADDIPVELIKTLAGRGKVSLDVQGYLRRLVGEQVCLTDWAEKREALKFVHILKANESEMEALTGLNDVHQAAAILFEWGVKEIVITLGSKGSVIYDGSRFYLIPAYRPLTSVVDATGCGDTYMAGYLYRRLRGAGFQEAGEFAAAIATLKIESSGPFDGREQDIYDLLNNCSLQVEDYPID